MAHRRQNELHNFQWSSKRIVNMLHYDGMAFTTFKHTALGDLRWCFASDDDGYFEAIISVVKRHQVK